MKHIDRMHARELKKGSAELLILSLVEVRARHGYEIGKLIEQRSSGAITFSAAALYPLLYRLEKRGWILGRWVEQAGQRRRRCYRITATGRKVLVERLLGNRTVRIDGDERRRGTAECDEQDTLHVERHRSEMKRWSGAPFGRDER